MASRGAGSKEAFIFFFLFVSCWSTAAIAGRLCSVLPGGGVDVAVGILAVDLPYSLGVPS